MKKNPLWSMLVVFLVMFVVGCGGKTTSLEGKVVDGKDNPLANVKVAAKMSQPIKGYEQFETTTGSDGTFKFKKLFPTSKYILSFFSDKWTIEQKMKIVSGPEGQTKMLPEPMTIRFMDPKEGVVLDTKTNLMWAARGSGSEMNWYSAKSYCENYREGGYTDWRMPTHDELAELDASNTYKYKIDLTGSSGRWIWAAETRGSDAAAFSFQVNGRLFFARADVSPCKALPVRSGK
jgi:hypothetical protein